MLSQLSSVMRLKSLLGNVGLEFEMKRKEVLLIQGVAWLSLLFTMQGKGSCMPAHALAPEPSWQVSAAVMYSNLLRNVCNTITFARQDNGFMCAMRG